MITGIYERYTAFCTILIQTETLSPIIAKSIRSLCKKIECKTLKNCLSTVDSARKDKLKKHYSVSECGRLYLQGNFNQSCELAVNNILENPTDIESIQILSFFDNYEINDKLNKTVIGNIIKNLRKVRVFNDNTPEAYSKIRRFTWNNMDLPFSSQLNSIILNKSNLSTIEITSVNDYFLYSNSLDIFTAPLLRCNYYHVEQLHPSIKNITEIIKLNRNKEYDEVVTKIKSIINEDCEIVSINKAFLLHSLCISLIQTNDIFSSIKEVVDSSIKNRFLLSILPIKELIKGKRWKDFKNYKDNIELSIILHFYLILHEDSLQKTNLGFAWDWYRKSLGLINVSDIQLNDSSTTEREKAIYYLSEISTPETMEGHTEGLDTPLQTLISRSQILAKLIELDKSRDKSYEKEQVSLLKAISIQKGLDKLNQNKLYIDENIIKSWAQRELESSYEKYQEILIHPELNISENEASLSSDDEDKLISLIEKMVNINKEEHVTLFNSIAKEYLMNKQGGLNLFLSMRIRHGKLESTLRKPLSDSNLITKMSDGNAYLDNSYWIKKLGLDSEDAELLNERFRRLSMLFDTRINTFKEHRIRCYSPTNIHGVFYVNPTIDDYDDLKRKIASGVNFGTFCDESIKLCRRSIEGNLPMTKLLIESEIINLIISEINALLEYSEYKSYKPLSESIKIARNKFKKTGDIVKEWFNFDDVDVDAKSLTVDDCIDVSLANITDVHSDFTLDFERKITTHLSSLKLSDIDSNNLNEVFYILLDNIYKRSGLKDKVKVRVRITKQDDEHLKISIVNKVNENMINSENKNKIKEIKNIISTGLYETKASDEGNSGLIKLKNMNHSDKNSILFDFKFDSFIVKYNFKLL
ncbi:hypothetical protein [Vibrio anguillarum]|uniref:hypothetical protein n=1 Tax=Vibrio anguillarum TaxID=55601 RepID=UPI000B53B2E5|nr:hypothetical protein [Vibrio anguillarum]ASG03214.1 hypothetical protein CEJ46_04975 [Vibrio anguillarum]